MQSAPQTEFCKADDLESERLVHGRIPSGVESPIKAEHTRTLMHRFPD